MSDNLSLTDVKKKIALAIRNNYLNSQLPLIEFANLHGLSINTTFNIVNTTLTHTSDATEWTEVDLETYLCVADTLNITVTLDVIITRG